MANLDLGKIAVFLDIAGNRWDLWDRALQTLPRDPTNGPRRHGITENVLRRPALLTSNGIYKSWLRVSVPLWPTFVGAGVFRTMINGLGCAALS